MILVITARPSRLTIRLMIVLAAIFLFSVPADLDARTPASSRPPDADQALILQKRFENALARGDRSTLKELLANDATIVVVFPPSKGVVPPEQRGYWSRLFTKSELVAGTGHGGFRSFEEATRELVFHGSSFAASVRAEHLLTMGEFCAGVCVGFETTAKTYVTTYWTKTSKDWRVCFFESVPVSDAVNKETSITVTK